MAKNEPKIYRRGNTKRTIIKILLWLLVIVLILALTAFFGFRKYIAYTDTGKLYLDIPWLYGYMDGPPAVDNLAPYLEPVNTEQPETDVPVTEDEPTPESTSDTEAAPPDTGEDTVTQ